MTQEDAFAELVLMCSADYDPQLSEDDVLRWLNRARRPDSTGLVVGETGYALTYDLNWAAAKLWETKAARCVDYVSGSAGGGGFAFDQVFAHCREMAAYYRRGVNTTLRTPGPEYQRFYPNGY